MNEKMKTVVDNVKKVLKSITIYSIIGLSCIASFFIGYYYNKMNNKPHNNLIIIDIKSGDYTIYEDSIGNTIFSLYAKNVWGQHTQVTNP
jgi:hypothetical protein